MLTDHRSTERERQRANKGSSSAGSSLSSSSSVLTKEQGLERLENKALLLLRNPNLPEHPIHTRLHFLRTKDVPEGVIAVALRRYNEDAPQSQQYRYLPPPQSAPKDNNWGVNVVLVAFGAALGAGVIKTLRFLNGDDSPLLGEAGEMQQEEPQQQVTTNSDPENVSPEDVNEPNAQQQHHQHEQQLEEEEDTEEVQSPLPPPPIPSYTTITDASEEEVRVYHRLAMKFNRLKHYVIPRFARHLGSTSQTQERREITNEMVAFLRQKQSEDPETDPEPSPPQPQATNTLSSPQSSPPRPNPTTPPQLPLQPQDLSSLNALLSTFTPPKLRLLHMYLSNLAANPSSPHYSTVSISNSQFQRQLGGGDGEEVLCGWCGFKKDGATLRWQGGDVEEVEGVRRLIAVALQKS